MSFFGLFKSKQEKEMDKIKKKISTGVFPDGNQQIERETDEVSHLIGNKYPKDQMREVYIHIAFLFFIADKDRSEERIIMSTNIKMDSKIAEADILKIYDYVKNKFLKQQLGTEDQNELNESATVMFGGNIGCDTDEIPGGYGDFGYSATNPIPTKGIMGSNMYLSRLKPVYGDTNTEWKREDSCSVDNIENMIDEYKLSNSAGDCVATIYVSPYHSRNSEKAPNGFKLI